MKETLDKKIEKEILEDFKLSTSHSPKDAKSKAVSQCCGYPMFWSDGIILTCHKCQKEIQPKNAELERVLKKFNVKFVMELEPNGTKVVQCLAEELIPFITQVYKEAKEEGYAEGCSNPNYQDGYEAGKEEERERIINKIKRLKLWSKGTVDGTRSDILSSLEEKGENV